MVGDHILEKARETAERTQNGHLGLDSIEWHTSASARLGQFPSYLRKCLKKPGMRPSMIAVHLGTNDLMNLDNDKFMDKTAKVIESIEKCLPGCHVVWSSMLLPCLTDLHHSIRQIDTTRMKLNTMTHDMLQNHTRCHFVSYDHCFRRGSRSIYQSDGQGLSQMGVDNFLVILQKALAVFISDPQKRIYP